MANLILYYSRKGENYVNGGIQTLSKGNTKRVAEFIQKAVGGELFEVEPTREYSASYMTCIKEAQAEQRANERPAVKKLPESLDGYDTIFIGAPVWWGDWPMIMYTGFENNDFAGKTLIPFSTHEGSGLSGFDRKLSSACPDSTVLDGLAVRGNDAQNDQESVREAVETWVSGLGY